jgi:lysophospholipase L1-like esterase
MSRVLVGFAAIIAVPALVCLDTLIALARGWRPPSWHVLPAALAALVVLFPIAVVLPAIALALRRVANFYGRRAPHLALACVSVVLAALTANLLAHVEFDRWTSFHRRPPNGHLVFHSQPGLFPGVRSEAHYRTNALGMRGPEMPRDHRAYRILCIGGSATECVYLDDASTWPMLLMQSLNGSRNARPAWVGNVGISGYTSSEHLVFVTRSALMQQIDYAVFLVGFNDAGRVVIGAAETGPAPLWRRSALFLLATEAMRKRAERQLIDHIDAFGENIRLKRIRRQDAPKTGEVPDLSAPRQAYAARIEAIVKHCRERGVRPVMVAQPALYGHHLPPDVERRFWLGETTQGRFVEAGRLRDALDSFNATLIETCQRLGVDYLDLSDMCGRPEFFFDDCHFNEAGAKEVARRLTEYFERAGWS